MRALGLNLFLAVAMFALSCGSEPAPPKSLVDELVRKQREENLAIGWIEGQKLAAVMASAGQSKISEHSLSASEAEAAEKEWRARKTPTPHSHGTDAQRSPDGKWITYRTPRNKFVLADTAGKVQKELLSGEKVLTPLYWSPDSEYLLYIKASGAWDGGDACARNLTDTRYVMVYRLRDGATGSIHYVCLGFPYERFGWFTAPTGVLPKAR